MWLRRRGSASKRHGHAWGVPHQRGARAYLTFPLPLATVTFQVFPYNRQRLEVRLRCAVLFQLTQESLPSFPFAGNCDSLAGRFICCSPQPAPRRYGAIWRWRCRKIRIRSTRGILRENLPFARPSLAEVMAISQLHYQGKRLCRVGYDGLRELRTAVAAGQGSCCLRSNAVRRTVAVGGASAFVHSLHATRCTSWCVP